MYLLIYKLIYLFIYLLYKDPLLVVISFNQAPASAVYLSGQIKEKIGLNTMTHVDV